MDRDGAAADSGRVIRRRLRIRGRVQGVYFRGSTQDTAADVGATGWVRNLPDGTVEAEVQGTATVVDAVVAFCRTGPSYARVTGVDVCDIAPVADESMFQTR